MSSNVRIARLFDEIALLLELQEANPFKVRAYRRASRALEALSDDLDEMAAADRLTEVDGVGRDLAARISEFLDSGTISELTELREQVPAVLVEMTRIEGVGPKNAVRLHRELGVESLDELEAAARGGRVAELDGFGEKSQQNIIDGIDFVRRASERHPLGRVLPTALEIEAALAGLDQVVSVSIAGSLRRMSETVGDVDLVAASNDPTAVMRAFVEGSEVAKVIAHGETKSSIRTSEDVQVDLRVVEPEVFGAALLHFTGSKEHNVRLREMARRREMKVNEYGIFAVDSDRRLAAETEEACYTALGLPWIPPELREDTGEIQAALDGELPDLVELADIRGDLHAHTDWSDGKQTLEELVEAARRRGYAYVGVTDHSASLTIAGGLDPGRMEEQIERVRAADGHYKDIELLVGTEVDILRDGSVDYPDELLERLDIVIASVHTNFKLDRQAQTDRICAAMEHPLVFGIGHPTGRMLGQREAYALDTDRIIETAARTGTALEISANPQRLDLNDRHARLAHEAGVPLFVSTDAHRPDQFAYMGYGVRVARRAWLEKGAIVNTLTPARLRKALHRKRG